VRVLNVGGGSKDIQLPENYQDFEHILLDIAPGPGVDIVADVLTYEFSPWYDAVYCSHNLEHYYAHQTLPVLKKFYQALLPGGTVHIRVPDLQELFNLISKYKLKLEDTLYVCEVGPIMVQDVIYGYGKEIEQSGQPFYAHKTGFTATKLSRLMKEAGFQQVHVMQRRETIELEAIAMRQM